MSNELEDLLAEYWDAAYAEGASGRDHDTTDGRAQRALSALRGHFHALRARVARLEEALKELLDYTRACEGLLNASESGACVKARRALEEK